MPNVQKHGKDTVIFVTKEDQKSPSKITLPEPEPSPGLILPNGEINWNCPCLGGMATGPCGIEFREAFSCFHYSAADPKGSDCYGAFKTMQTCMTQYPELYGNKDSDLSELEEELNDREGRDQPEMKSLNDSRSDKQLTEKKNS